MNRLIVGFIVFILVFVVVILHVYGSYSITSSDEFKHAKRIASANGTHEVLFGNVFMSTPQQYVFLLKGSDISSENQYWSFVVDDSVKVVVNANTGLAMEEIESTLSLLKIPAFKEVFQKTLGLTSVLEDDENEAPYYSKLTNSNIVWEVKGTNEINKVQYTYLDFYTGQLVWNYQLK